VTVALDLPEVEHERFLAPPLKAMLGQVRFPPILRLAEATGLAPLQDALRHDFPELREEQQLSITLGSEGTAQSAQRLWRLSTADGTWSVLFAPDFVTLEAEPNQYTDYQEFRARFESLWGVVLEHLRPLRRVQQGLRYIDHIARELRGPDWEEWINPDLLGLTRLERFGDSLDHALTDLRFSLPDGQLSFKHGMVRAGPDNVPGYLLDFDCFTQEASAELDSDVVLNQFDSFHDVIWHLFRFSVTDQAVEEFRRG